MSILHPTASGFDYEVSLFLSCYPDEVSEAVRQWPGVFLLSLKGKMQVFAGHLNHSVSGKLLGHSHILFKAIYVQESLKGNRKPDHRFI